MSADPGPARLASALWPLVPGTAVVAAVAGLLLAPLATVAAVLGLAVLAASVRWPRETALAAMVGGPLYLSGYAAGPVTADNVAVLYGAAVGAAWLLARRRSGTPLAAWPVALALAVTLAAAANGGAGLQGTVRFLSLAVLALVLVNSTPAARSRTVAWVEVAVTVGALVLLAQPLTGYPAAFGTAEGVGLRFGGLFGHPNFAAYTICLVLLYQVYARRFTALRVASTAVLLTALLLTGSRAALLVFLVLLLPAVWLRARRFLGLLVPAVVALPFVGTTVLTRLESISRTGGLSGQNASGWRLGQWQDALEATRGHELLGIGWGQTVSVMGDELGAHSTYVQLWLEVGRVGTVVAAVGLAVLLGAARGSRTAQVLLAYAVVASVSDPVLLYPSCLTVLLVLLSELLPARDAGTAAAPGSGEAGTAAPTTTPHLQGAPA
ncbi:O-antigen ligase like membrane protein [Geodermatophilus telluris]|uniref:O-antigen ligase like membrane protein n=1 Tax=Geodermatophilus telluris TaxID=1190417 RepID=A0A1G6M2I8_9ACTN|nr:O-antigen ligase family protein [Geodermatophilus telluris]SDC49699.1 O-antigen ligase like membrane protein [Geodermatophilus telluris]